MYAPRGFHAGFNAASHRTSLLFLVSISDRISHPLLFDLIKPIPLSPNFNSPHTFKSYHTNLVVQNGSTVAPSTLVDPFLKWKCHVVAQLRDCSPMRKSWCGINTHRLRCTMILKHAWFLHVSLYALYLAFTLCLSSYQSTLLSICFKGAFIDCFYKGQGIGLLWRLEHWSIHFLKCQASA